MNSKLHVVCDGDGKLLAMLLSEGQMSDHPKQIKQWRDQLLEGVTGIFGKAGKAEAALVIDVKSLRAKIGELTLENGFFIRRARQGGSADERKAMIDRRSQLSVTLQAKLLGIGRGSVYYRPRPASESDLKLMQRIDRLQLELPFVERLHNGESDCRTTGMLLVAL